MPNSGSIGATNQSEPNASTAPASSSERNAYVPFARSAPMEPLMGIYGAVTRRTLDGANPEGWVPGQKIGVADAVRAYTSGSAYAEGQEAVKGTLEPGKLADRVVLSEDIFAIDPVAIEHVQVDTTILGGEVVYQRSAD